MAQITNPSFYIKIKYLFIILIILFCLILAKLEWILKEMCKKKNTNEKERMVGYLYTSTLAVENVATGNHREYKLVNKLINN